MRRTAFITLACAALAAALFAFARPEEREKHFKALAQDHIAGVQAGRLAEEKAESDLVKDFARRLAERRNTMMEAQRELAARKGLVLPGKPSREDLAAMRELEDLSGEKFDGAFAERMVRDHEKALRTARLAAENAEDADVKALAEAMRPEIEQQLKAARELSRKVK